jgi:hypothetical protein
LKGRCARSPRLTSGGARGHERHRIEVQIRANVAGLKDGLKDGAGAVATSSQQMSADLRGIGTGARDAHGPFSGFTSVLKEYRSEMRQEARLGRFLAADIASMGIASKGAAGEITQFIGAFAFGGGLGVAIEGVKFLIGKINEVSHEEEAAKASLKAYADEGAASLKKLTTEVDKLFMSKKQLLFLDEVVPELKKLDDLQNKLTKATDEYGEANTRAAEVLHASGVKGADFYQMLGEATKKSQKAVDDLTGAYRMQQFVVEQAKKRISQLVDTETARTRAIADAESRQRQEIEDAEINKAALMANQDIAQAKRVADFKKELEQEIEDARRRADQASEDSAINLARITTEQDEDALARAQQLKDQKELWKEIRPEVAHIASDVAQMLIDGKSLDDVLKDIATQILKTAIQVGIQGLFGLGPLALFEHGGDVPSAAAGWDVPSASGGIPAVLHPREMVLPEKYADVIRGAAAGGGGGGVTVQINGVIDGGHLMRVVHSREFADAMKSARRMGRLP